MSSGLIGKIGKFFRPNPKPGGQVVDLVSRTALAAGEYLIFARELPAAGALHFTQVLSGVLNQQLKALGSLAYSIKKSVGPRSV